MILLLPMVLSGYGLYPIIYSHENIFGPGPGIFGKSIPMEKPPSLRFFFSGTYVNLGEHMERKLVYNKSLVVFHIVFSMVFCILIGNVAMLPRFAEHWLRAELFEGGTSRAVGYNGYMIYVY